MDEPADADRESCNSRLPGVSHRFRLSGVHRRAAPLLEQEAHGVFHFNPEETRLKRHTQDLCAASR